MTDQRTRSHFDGDFFRRFYENPRTAVISEDEVNRLARFVVAYLDHLCVPVRSALDVGCGVGRWKGALQRLNKNIEYTGIDVADYVCEKYGWTQASIATYAPAATHDLIVCQDVLHYLTDGETRDGMENIARMCSGALYLDVMTKEDQDAGLYDTERTDPRMRVRSVTWYRELIEPHFFGCGGGVFLPKDSDAVVLALERS